MSRSGPPKRRTFAETLYWVSLKASITSFRQMMALIQSECPFTAICMNFTR
jgi:hypothetical protein